MTLPQLSLRDLFWLVLMAALGLGWWVDHQRPVPQIPLTPPAQAGRWEVVIGKDGAEILLDTATGETWRYESYRWLPRPAPAK
jgi:hypothetical protein